MKHKKSYVVADFMQTIGSIIFIIAILLLIFSIGWLALSMWFPALTSTIITKLLLLGIIIAAVGYLIAIISEKINI